MFHTFEKQFVLSMLRGMWTYNCNMNIGVRQVDNFFANIHYNMNIGAKQVGRFANIQHNMNISVRQVDVLLTYSII